MKIIIKEQQLENLASQLVLGKLSGMDFKFKKYKEFSFFPKGTHDADNGIESDWVRHEGYSILIGHSLFRSVRDLHISTNLSSHSSYLSSSKISSSIVIN